MGVVWWWWFGLVADCAVGFNNVVYLFILFVVVVLFFTCGLVYCAVIWFIVAAFWLLDYCIVFADCCLRLVAYLAVVFGLVACD